MLQLNKDNLAQLWEAEVTTGCHVGGRTVDPLCFSA